MIAVLAPHVIDQIAAGEVIERPASVVKELVDNAIDAGARSIAVDVTAGGRGVIRVSDDGCGMSPKDAVLALERHATSKLRQVDELWELSTMGFRGEALPSIASVSRMTLTTRRAGDDAATRIAIEAGRLVSVSDAGAPVGTTVEVADLLYNVPARLKFLKGEATEASHITELIGKIAMAYPRLHVRLRHNGRTALDAPPDRDGFARAQALLGTRIAARMVPVSGEESGVRVIAYLGAPELAQATARGVQLFVGRRPVRDRGLLHALAMGYGELVPRGRHPFAIVMLDAPAGTVDINVHPQKLEVRFSDPAVVCAAVRHIVQAGVAAARWRDDAAGGSPVQLVGMVGTLPGIAPPLAPHAAAATPLAERHAAEMRSRQVSLGFDAAPEIRASRGPIAAPRPGGAYHPRDWARSLREQTQASRVAEEPAVYWPSSGVAEDIPRLPSLAEHVREARDPRAEERDVRAGGDAGDARGAGVDDKGNGVRDAHVGAVQGRDVRADGDAGDSRFAGADDAGARVRDAHVGAAQGRDVRAGGDAGDSRFAGIDGAGARVRDAHVGAPQGRDVRAGGDAGDSRFPGAGDQGGRIRDAHVGAAEERFLRAGGYAVDSRVPGADNEGNGVREAHVGAAQERDVHAGGDAGDSRFAGTDGAGARVRDAHVGAAQGRDVRAGGDAGDSRFPGADDQGGRIRDAHVGAAEERFLRAGGYAVDSRVPGADNEGHGVRDAHVGAAQGRDVRAGGDAGDSRFPGADDGRGMRTGDADAAMLRSADSATGFFSQLRYLGQLDLTYLACEGDGELILIDQHAAHERVELARLRKRHACNGDARVAVQKMLFPVTLDATPAQLALAARLGELLAQVGFEVEPFGKATLAVKAVPAGIRHGDPAQLLRRLLHDWAEAGAPGEAERLDALLGTIACHSVVRAGDRLTPGEVETLLRSLDGIDPSLPAPHGRAVLLRLPLSEIGRRFGRS